MTKNTELIVRTPGILMAKVNANQRIGDTPYSERSQPASTSCCCTGTVHLRVLQSGNSSTEFQRSSREVLGKV